jgi:hypothetical protein
MLIVGGTAALTAIFVYLAWHFFRQWRSTPRRKAGPRSVTTQARPERERPRQAHAPGLMR